MVALILLPCVIMTIYSPAKLMQFESVVLLNSKFKELAMVGFLLHTVVWLIQAPQALITIFSNVFTRLNQILTLWALV